MRWRSVFKFEETRPPVRREFPGADRPNPKKLEGTGPRVAKRNAGRNRPASRRFLGRNHCSVKSALGPVRRVPRAAERLLPSRNRIVSMQPAVVVTGASSGLGVEFAKLAVGEGAKVVLIARSRPQLDALAARLDPSGRSTVVLSLDLAARDAGETVACDIEALDLYCHILINNAGFGLFGDAVELDRERQLGVIDVNVRA